MIKMPIWSIFTPILHATKMALPGTSVSPFKIGIGMEDPCIVEDVASTVASMLAEKASSVILVVYCPTGQASCQFESELIDARPCVDPAGDLISDLKAGKLNAIIRGQLSSSRFLKELKRQFSTEWTYRLALLSTSEGKDFFFAPVGIDEATTSRDKHVLIEHANLLLESLDIVPSFFLISAGRLDDAGRGEKINKSIQETIELVKLLKHEHPTLAVQHGEILIENAFDRGANTIIAPDGISGNLIYRTLLHLGSGHSHGAYYLGNDYPGPVMDTSRVGSVEEYAGAVVLALRMLVSTDEEMKT